MQKPVPETDHSYSTHEDPSGSTETVSPPKHDTVDPSNGACLENGESLVNNTDQNGSINDASAAENITSDSQPAVQNGCVQLHQFQQTRDSWLLKLLVSRKGFLVNEDIHAIYVGKVLTCRFPLPCIMQSNIQMILFNVSTAYCSHTVLSPNGLFKHQRSHLYLKHACDFCENHQLQWHSKIHTGSGLFPCLHCDKKYTTNSVMLEHAKSHNVNLQCDLCPLSVEKRYNSMYALAQHKRGMHGPGCNSPCGINYKWKSHYSRHLNSGCDTCDQYHANKRKKRFLFAK